MGVVIEFRPRTRKQGTVSESERLRAMIEGKIERYECGECGGEIEVIDENYPSICPCCGRTIEWED